VKAPRNDCRALHGSIVATVHPSRWGFRSLWPTLVLPSAYRNAAPPRGTQRNPKEPTGNGFPSNLRDFQPKSACALGYLGSPLPISNPSWDA
jgi:hypothetical protein